MKQKYYANLSFLRAVACVAIVVLHTVNSAAILYEGRISRVDYGVSMAVVEALAWAVPCFLMVTGALLLDPAREISLKKLFTRYILRVLLALAVSVLIFRGFDMLLNGEVFSLSAIGRGFLNILTGESWAHLWYLYVLIGLYLLLPLFRAAAEKLSEKTLWYLALVLFVFVSLMPLLKLLGIESGFSLPVVTVYPLYLILGYLLFQKPFSRLISAALILIGAGGLAAAAYLRYAWGIDSLSLLLNYASPLTVLLSCGVFSLFARLSADTGEKNIFTRAVLSLDRASFGIYLFHLVFVRLVLRYWGVDPYSLGIWSFAVISIAVLAVSFLLVRVLCLIPGFEFILGRQSKEYEPQKQKTTASLMKLAIFVIVAGVIAAVTFGMLRHPNRLAFLPARADTASSEETHEASAEPEIESSVADESSLISENSIEESVSEEDSGDNSMNTEPSENSEEESSAWETPAYEGVNKDQVREENPQAAAVLDEVGWDLKEAFEWVAKFPWARMSVDYTMGSEWFKDFGYENHYGNCYVMAATFCDLAKALGYDARQMLGEVPMERGGYGRHSWVEIKLAGGTYVFDPDYQSETKKSGYLLTYEQGDTWVYMNIEPMP